MTLNLHVKFEMDNLPKGFAKRWLTLSSSYDVIPAKAVLKWNQKYLPFKGPDLVCKKSISLQVDTINMLRCAMPHRVLYA